MLNTSEIRVIAYAAGLLRSDGLGSSLIRSPPEILYTIDCTSPQ